MNTPRTAPPTPPARGSFPLDHAGACKRAADEYLICIKKHGNSHADCRELSRVYLECRMDKGLMAKENLDSLGFGKDVVIKPAAPAKVDEGGEVIAGLASARKAKGAVFGIALPGSGYVAPAPEGGLGAGHGGGARGGGFGGPR